MLRRLVVATVLAMTATVTTATAAHAEPVEETARCVVAAHRGDHGGATENSLNAVRSAIAAGVDYIELDVRTSRDGVFVVMHDATLDRTSNGTGPLAALRWRQLRALRLDDGQRVPSLAAVLRVAKPSPVQVLLEMKAVSVRDQARLATRVREFGTDRVVVNSFSRTSLLDLRAAHPTMRTALDTWHALPVTEASRYGALLVHHAAVTEEWLTEMRGAGIPVYGWTMDTEDVWAALGARLAAVITNRPQDLLAYRDSGSGCAPVTDR